MNLEESFEPRNGHRLSHGGLQTGQHEPLLTSLELSQELHQPELTKLQLGEIAGYLPEPTASAIRARSMALREMAQTLKRKNRLAAQVAQDLQTHIRGIFAELAKVNQEQVVYGPRGNHEQTSTRSWVDAVG